MVPSQLAKEQWFLVETLVLGKFSEEMGSREEDIGCSGYNSFRILITFIQRRSHRGMGIGRGKQQSH